jgi:hypothetical protein
VFVQGISKNFNLDGIVLYEHCMMQAANRRTNVVQTISKQMTVVHDQLKKKERVNTLHTIHYTQYITHNTLHTIYYTQYITHNTLYTIHYTQYITHNTQYLTLGFSYRASFMYYDKGYQQMALSFVIFLYSHISSLHVSGLYQLIIRGILSCCLFVTTWFM